MPLGFFLGPIFVRSRPLVGRGILYLTDSPVSRLLPRLLSLPKILFSHSLPGYLIFKISLVVSFEIVGIFRKRWIEKDCKKDRYVKME
jgi:hypothetical protein